MTSTGLAGLAGLAGSPGQPGVAAGLVLPTQGIGAPVNQPGFYVHGPMGLQQVYASPIGLDRLVRQEVALGLVREIVPPESHIGLSLFPFMEVPTDDVIFNYALGMTDGLAPARAEDAESELAQKDDIFASEGRASVIDWAVKDHYTASDVSRYREWLRIQELMRDGQMLPLTVNSMTADFQSRFARDTLRRRRKLDNRIETLIMTSLSTGAYSYNDGRIKFTVDWGRPAGNAATLSTTNVDLASNTAYPLGTAWTRTDSDPIKTITSVQQYCYDVYGVRITRALTSRKVLNNVLNSDRFIARTGLITQSGSTSVDPKYLIDGWGPKAAQAIIEQQTGLVFMEYDSVMRTRAVGSTTTQITRFVPEDVVIFLPEESDIAEFDDTGLGLGKVLTSPHPAGNWTAGFYEWEKEYGVDPWGYDAGTGIKCFPVFPHMDKTFVIDVLI
jgi:hypothetical protein